jgi:hypothetical protein
MVSNEIILINAVPTVNHTSLLSRESKTIYSSRSGIVPVISAKPKISFHNKVLLALLQCANLQFILIAQEITSVYFPLG